MSVLSEKVRTATYAALAADDDLTALAPGGVWFQLAPAATPDAFIVMDRIPVSVNYAFGGNLTHEEDLIRLKPVVASDFSTAKSGASLAEEILAQADAVLEAGVTITGERITRFQRVSEIPPFFERTTGRTFHHHAANYAVVTEV